MKRAMSEQLRELIQDPEWNPIRNPIPGSYYWRRKWEAACHEAGRAVIAIVLGGECERVHVSHNGEGGALISRPNDQARIVALMAGAEAAKIICGRRGKEGDERDRECILMQHGEVAGAIVGGFVRASCGEQTVSNSWFVLPGGGC